jgi:predicted metal-dependent peptidase
MLENPYFGSIVSTLDICSNNQIETYKGNGERLYYNEDYIEECDSDDVEFILASSAMHRVLQHQNRAIERHSKVWQLASDFVVNSMMMQNGFELPIKANYQDRFREMYVEEVYAILMDEMEDEYAKENEEQITQDDESLDQEFLEQLFKKFEESNMLPKDIEYILTQHKSHTINWRDELYRYIATYDKSQFSFFPPNMKYLYRGIYIPSLNSDLLSIVVAIDTSGSIDDGLLATFLAEVEAIMENYPHYQIDLIQADSKVQSHQVFTTGEPINYRVKGRGATNFIPTFEYIDTAIGIPTLLIYFSDGAGEFPKDLPAYDVLWVSHKAIEVPFGDNIVMEE